MELNSAGRTMGHHISLPIEALRWEPRLTRKERRKRSRQEAETFRRGRWGSC